MKEQFLEAMTATASVYEKICHRLHGLSESLQRDPARDVREDIYSLVRSAEINTLELRNLAARTMGKKREELGNILADAHGIKITKKEDILIVRMPGILPNRNSKDNTRFITRPLAAALTQYLTEHPCPRFHECVICIVHRYDESMGLWRVRDYDNIETKRYLDVLEALFLTNDSGMLCSVFQTTRLDVADGTEFHIMKPEVFPDWLEEHC